MHKTVAWMTAAMISLPSALMAQTEEITARPVGDDAAAAPQEPPPAGGELRRDDGWNSAWALHFGLNAFMATTSWLTNFDNYSGMAGIQYNLSNTMAARVGVTYNRSSNPRDITKTTVTNGSNVQETYAYNTPDKSATNTLRLRADVLQRMGTHIVGAYAGAGMFYEYDITRVRAKDDVTVVNEITHRNNTVGTHNLGVRGILGAEWRIHSNFALYAEYGLAASLIRIRDQEDKTTIERTISGVRSTQETRVERSTTRMFNVSSSLEQGASLGLAVHFQ
jgi:hypothetical protein